MTNLLCLCCSSVFMFWSFQTLAENPFSPAFGLALALSSLAVSIFSVRFVLYSALDYCFEPRRDTLPALVFDAPINLRFRHASISSAKQMQKSTDQTAAPKSCWH